jgi:DNA-binding MarR family transcriptional regulator
MTQKPCLDTDALTVHPALKEFFGYCLVKSALKLRGMMDSELSRFGLIAPMLGILRILRHGGPASQVELGRATGIDKASMVKVIDELEELGMVTRTEGAPDRRIKLVSLTKSGARRLDQAAKVREKVEEAFLAPLSAQEKKALRAALPKLIG